MPKELKITCDGCGRDISTTGSMPDYRLCLSPEKIPHDFGEAGGGIVYGIMVYPPIRNDIYACGIPCLRKWMNNNFMEPIE